MRWCRFGKSRLGLVRADRVIDVTPILNRLPSYRCPLPRHDQERGRRHTIGNLRHL